MKMLKVGHKFESRAVGPDGSTTYQLWSWEIAQILWGCIFLIWDDNIYLIRLNTDWIVAPPSRIVKPLTPNVIVFGKVSWWNYYPNKKRSGAISPLLTPPLYGEDFSKKAICRKMLLMETKYWHLDLELPSLWELLEINICYFSHPVHGILL